MSAKTRIIALIDFSEYSSAMIDMCVRWCEIADAELHLLHRVPGLIPARATSIQKEVLVETEVEGATAQMRKIMEGRSSAVPVSYHVTPYNLVETLWKMVQEGNNDFIVAGLKGTGRWKSILLGGVTTHVINELEHTVITVPEKLCRDDQGPCNLVPSKVVVLVKGEFGLNEKAFSNLLTTFNKAIREVIFVTVLEKGDNHEEARASLSRLATQYANGRATAFEIFEGNVLEEVRAYVQHDSDTVLVTQKGSRTLTDRPFRRFFINRLVEDGSMPMVVLPFEGEPE